MPQREDRVPPDSQATIDEQRREIERLREDLRRSEAERQRLRRENEKLKDELEAARRTSARQAAPFSRGTRVAQPKRPGRKPGAGHGRHGHRLAPTYVDETYDAPLPAQCPGCAGALCETGVATQYQEELPIAASAGARLSGAHRPMPAVSPPRAGRHPLQTSEALGAAGVVGGGHPLTTVYAIPPGRGLAQAATLIGPDYPGVRVRDGWQSYRQFHHAQHQTCLAHLLRTCRRLLLDYPDQPWVHAVKRILQAALRTRAQFRQGTVSAQGLGVARGQYLERLGRLLARTPSRRLAVRRFQRHLVREYDANFRFLVDPTLDATNWRAEQARRPTVVTRKMCGGGNRTARGAQSQQILMTLLRTADRRGLDATALLTSVLAASLPRVPLALQSVPAAH